MKYFVYFGVQSYVQASLISNLKTHESKRAKRENQKDNRWVQHTTSQWRTETQWTLKEDPHSGPPLEDPVPPQRTPSPHNIREDVTKTHINKPHPHAWSHKRSTVLQPVGNV